MNWQPAFPEPGPGRDEVERAIASITGSKVPPNPDAWPIAKLLQGALAGEAMKAAASERPTLPIKVREVLMPHDRDGNYENHFIVVTTSGIRLKVTVEPEEEV